MQPALSRQLPLAMPPAQSRRRLGWLISVLLVISFALIDTAVVGWDASILTGGEIFAGAFTFWLLSLGMVVTIWKLDR
jgi:hypothetical protein